MPGSFWGGPPRNNNKPLRRRRSLLGRKIHSENDLPEQDTTTTSSLPQQQQQQHPHTALILPENVKTILIAGTPECWQLTTSATPYSPTTATASISSHCDASQVTLGSEFSPGASTIDEEEPYEGGLNWLLQNNNAQSNTVTSTRPRKTSPSVSQGRRKTAARSAQRREAPASTEQEQKEPSSMVVMYRNSPSPPPPQQALHIWCK